MQTSHPACIGRASVLYSSSKFKHSLRSTVSSTLYWITHYYTSSIAQQSAIYFEKYFSLLLGTLFPWRLPQIFQGEHSSSLVFFSLISLVFLAGQLTQACTIKTLSERTPKRECPVEETAAKKSSNFYKILACNTERIRSVIGRCMALQPDPSMKEIYTQYQFSIISIKKRQTSADI